MSTDPQSPTGHVLVLQHHPDEHPAGLTPLLGAAGLALSAVELDAGEPVPDLEPFDVMVVMGGPQNAWEEDEYPYLVAEKAAIRRWVLELDRPFLGVCLGHQLLADALGGTVGRMGAPEIGVVDIELTDAGLADPVVGRLAAKVPGLQWHEAEVSEAPPGGIVLATNPASPVQAFRFGRAIGVQFHLEVERDTVPKWAAVPEYERTLAECFGTAQALQDEVERAMDVMAESARALVGGFLDDVLETAPRP